MGKLLVRLAVIIVSIYFVITYLVAQFMFVDISSDLLTRLDNSFNFLSVTAHNLIPIGILALGIGISITLAIRHFYKVMKLQSKLKDRTL